MKSLLLVFLIIPNLIISDTPKLNITLTQIENWIVELKITQDCSDSCRTLRGTLVIPYNFTKNSNELKKQIRINSISIFDTTIIRNVSIPVYDTELTMEKEGKVGSTVVEIIADSITVMMPNITNVRGENLNNGPIKVILDCGNCNSSIVIPEGTEVPDDTFKIIGEGNNYTFLRSCTPIQKKITSNTSFNITCIPFSPGIFEYNKIANAIDKMGFIHIKNNTENSGLSYKSGYKDCESLLHGNPIYYDINSEINPTFTLTSPSKIENDNDIPFLFANDTYIRNNKINLCNINPNNKFEIICGVSFINFPHFKQDEDDSSVYFIYEEAKCGKAFTGVIVISSNQSFIKAGIFSIFLILLF